MTVGATVGMTVSDGITGVTGVGVTPTVQVDKPKIRVAANNNLIPFIFPPE
jgi:hypothetical protein